MNELSSILEDIKNYRHFVIYGAQVVGYGIYCALKSVISVKPDCFLVTTAENNPKMIDDIKVCTISEYLKTEDKNNILVLVAVTEVYQTEICRIVKDYGFSKVLCISGHIEHLIMSYYLEKNGGFKSLKKTCYSIPDINILENFKVFVVKNKQDKILISEIVKEKWEHTIQSGKFNTERKIAEYTDDIGNNISAKNSLYSELSATYWIWKNIQCDWKGIAHYRRRLCLDEYQIFTLIQDKIDVILPLPYVCYPNAMSQLERFISKYSIELLYSAMKEVHGSEADIYWQLLDKPYQYAYNLLCANSDVFEDYCNFMFMILEVVESMDKTGRLEYRSLAYLGEVLTSMYFLHNSDKLRIQHVEKKILF